MPLKKWHDAVAYRSAILGSGRYSGVVAAGDMMDADEKTTVPFYYVSKLSKRSQARNCHETARRASVDHQEAAHSAKRQRQTSSSTLSSSAGVSHEVSAREELQAAKRMRRRQRRQQPWP